MEQETYLARLARAANWYLPRSEAAEIVNDYQALLERHQGGPLSMEELGTPAHAATLLADHTAYRRWLAVFGLLAMCLLVPEVSLLRGQFTRPGITVLAALPLVGGAVALIWFRPAAKGEKTPLPKGLLPAMAGVLAVLLAAGALLWGLACGAWEALPTAWYGTIAHGGLCLAGTASAAAGLWGLVRARMADRRWRALYVLGLTALVECALVTALLTCVDPFSPNWWAPYVLRCAFAGVAGLVGSGVELC